MKRRILMLVTALVLLFSCFNAYAEEMPKEKLYLYVSPNGSDENSGTIESPFKTIEKARDTIRAVKQETGLTPYKEVVVYLRGGVYPVRETITLDSRDGGTEECRITYSAFPGEKPVVSSGYYLDPADFQNVTDREVLERLSDSAKKKVKTINLKKMGITDYGKLSQVGDFAVFTEGDQMGMMLFSGDKTYELARWPNTSADGHSQTVETDKIINGLDGYIYRAVTKQISTFTVPDDVMARMKTWKTYDDIWVLGSWNWVFFIDSLPIVSVDESQNLINVYGGARGGWASGKPFYFFNVLEELDLPGEYYIDREKGILYVYPDENFLNGETVKLSGNPGGKYIFLMTDGADYINLNGIEFELSTYHGVQTLESAYQNITNCSFNNCGGCGLFVGEEAYFNMGGFRAPGMSINEKYPHYSTDNHDINVINCEAINQGSIGFKISAGVGDTFEPGNVQILNCRVENVGHIMKASTTGFALHGSQNKLQNCQIERAPYLGIWYAGTELEISHNDVSDFMRDYQDGGAIYTMNNNSTNEVHHNWIHGVPDLLKKTSGDMDQYSYFFDADFRTVMKMGIYQDGTTAGGHVHHNVIEDVMGGIQTYWIGTNAHDNIFHNVYTPYSLSTGFYSKQKTDAGGYWWEANAHELFAMLKKTNPQIWHERHPEVIELMEEIDYKVEHDYDNYHLPYLTMKDGLIVFGEKTLDEYELYFNFGEKSLFGDYDVSPRLSWRIQEEGAISQFTRGGSTYENNVVALNDVGFVDYQNGDLTLREDAEILKTHPGLADIKMDEMGLMYDKLDETIADAVVFSKDSCKAIVNGEEKMLVSGNPEVETTVLNGEAKIPVSFARVCFGESITDKKDGSISLNEIAEKTGKKLYVGENGLYALYDGEKLFTDSDYDVRLQTVLSAIMK